MSQRTVSVAKRPQSQRSSGVLPFGTQILPPTNVLKSVYWSTENVLFADQALLMFQLSEVSANVSVSHIHQTAQN